ncbi:UNVERIFIED_CONTAM: Triacylglycerol lipase 2 [Sesamum calycinum]|uniref:Triacylglycerol lipase 2 n=1 Tax=Sesamum calycinum TaxID=2727403 RepID=A0AAW2Q3H2_9LAMI
MEKATWLDGVTWLLSPPEQSLALVLADNGFDVWVVNARGTKYSLGHKSLSSNDPAFWDWSWDELAAYDLPATFQYIYDQTSQKLHYVGHSMKHINCVDLLTSYTGQNCCLNSSMISSFLKHEPQSTSTKNMIHFAQMIRQGTIAMYDYGSEDDNNKHYGQTTPPDYNMTSIPNDLPLFLGYGGEDLLSDVKDVQTLINALSDHEPDKLVLQYIQDYAHLDFVYAINAKQVVYDPLVAFFRLN